MRAVGISLHPPTIRSDVRTHGYVCSIQIPPARERINFIPTTVRDYLFVGVSFLFNDSPSLNTHGMMELKEVDKCR